jgi:hypothetical protein
MENTAKKARYRSFNCVALLLHKPPRGRESLPRNQSPAWIKH